MRMISECVMSAMMDDPYLTARGLIKLVFDVHGISVSESTISRCRRSLNLRYKRAQRSREAQRVDPAHSFLSPGDPYAGAIALDESSFVSLDSPSMGWARGSRRVAKGPPLRRRRVSLLLAIDASGVVASEIRHGAFKGSTYAEFLTRLPKNRTILADNCSIHKARIVKDVADARNQRLRYTPPYCPWFNPVEYAFSKTKAAYRRARLQGHADFTVDVVEAVGRITSDDCAAFFEHARRNRRLELDEQMTPTAAL